MRRIVLVVANVLAFFIFTSSISAFKTHNDTCQSTIDCKWPLTCHNLRHQCVCPIRQLWSSSQNACISIDSGVCRSDSHCQDADPNLRCLSTGHCACRHGYSFDQQWMCRPTEPKSMYGQTCQSENDCPGYKLTCWSSHCKCDYGYQWSEELNSCVTFTDGFCETSNQCQDRDRNRICAENTCLCRTGFSPDPINKKCKSDLLTKCWSNNDCRTPLSVCNGDESYYKQCTCFQTHEPVDGECRPKMCQGNWCWSRYFVSDDGLGCVKGWCQCENEYALSNSTGKCEKSNKSWSSSVRALAYLTVAVGLILFMPVAFMFVVTGCKKRRMRRNHDDGDWSVVSTPDSGSLRLAPGERPPSYEEAVRCNRIV